MVKDFLIFLVVYLFPPAHLLLNRYADYPNKPAFHGTVSFVSRLLKLTKKDEKVREGDKYNDLIWVSINTAFLTLVSFLTFLTNFTTGNYTLIEKFGVPGMFFFRAFSNAWLLALSER